MVLYGFIWLNHHLAGCFAIFATRFKQIFRFFYSDPQGLLARLSQHDFHPEGDWMLGTGMAQGTQWRCCRCCRSPVCFDCKISDSRFAMGLYCAILVFVWNFNPCAGNHWANYLILPLVFSPDFSLGIFVAMGPLGHISRKNRTWVWVKVEDTLKKIINILSLLTITVSREVKHSNSHWRHLNSLGELWRPYYEDDPFQFPPNQLSLHWRLWWGHFSMTPW